MFRKDLFSYSEGFKDLIITLDYKIKVKYGFGRDISETGRDVRDYSKKELCYILEFLLYYTDDYKYKGENLPPKFIRFVADILHHLYGGDASAMQKYVIDEYKPIYVNTSTKEIISIEEFKPLSVDKDLYIPDRVCHRDRLPKHIRNSWESISTIFDKVDIKDKTTVISTLNAMLEIAKSTVHRYNISNLTVPEKFIISLMTTSQKNKYGLDIAGFCKDKGFTDINSYIVSLMTTSQKGEYENNIEGYCNMMLRKSK